MKKKKLNWKLYAAIAGAIIVLAVIGWYYFSPSEAEDYQYMQVDRGPMRVTLRESAVVQPEHRLTVTPPIPGRIDTIEVANGVPVKRGQVLAWISSTERAALMDSARAEGGKEINYWEDIYKPAPLIAPLDGNIISTAVVPGQVVVAAQTVFTMSDHLIVQASVDETDLNHVWLGQTADITFDSFPDAHLSGKVHEIAFDSTTVNNVTTYIVNIYLDKTPDYIRSGVSANVFLLISDRPSVLRVPTYALSTDNTVLVAQGKDQQPKSVKVETGATDGTYTEITSGLNEGDWIAMTTFAIKAAEKNGFSFTNAGKPQPKKKS